MEAPLQSHSLLSFTSNIGNRKVIGSSYVPKIKLTRRGLEIVSLGMLAPRKFMHRRRKVEVFKDAADEADQKSWRRLMLEIEKSGTAVAILQNHRTRGESLPKTLVVGTLMRFKQMKKWNIVSEILEWLRTQHWWDFGQMDFLLLITAYGKIGDFNKAERVMRYMNKKGFPPSVISSTALIEAYGRGGQCSKAEAVFQEMQTSGPEPSAVTYQIILKTLVEADKYEESEDIFESLLNDDRCSFKPDQKMFHMMIYMHKKSGNYESARRVFAQMSERGIPKSTVTFNSLMSFENNHKEVSNIYDQMQRDGLRPDVVSYALLIHAYGKARREAEALAVFEEMLDAGVRPTRKAYNTLLDAFAISGMVEEAKTVFQSMRRDRCDRDLYSYATMLSAYVNASDMEGAEKFFRRLKQDGLEPNVVIYGTLMKGYAKANDVGKMMEKYEEMRGLGIEANQTIFTTLMDAHGKKSDFGSAVVWFNEMAASRGVPPDQKAKNILLSLAKTVEEQDEANELVGNPPVVVVDTTVDNIVSSGMVDLVEANASKYARFDDDEDDDDDDIDLGFVSLDDIKQEMQVEFEDLSV